MTADIFRTLVESAPARFIVHDEEGRILDASAPSCAMLGYSREELLTMRVHDISSGITPAGNAAIWSTMEPGDAREIRQVSRRRDGSTFSSDITVACQIIDGRKLFFGLARDASRRETGHVAIGKLTSKLERRVEERTRELREARETLQAVIDSAHDVIIYQDREGHYLAVNRAAVNLGGARAAEGLGKTAVDIFGPEIGRRMRAREQAVLASGVVDTVEERLPLPDGTRTFLTTRSIHRNSQGEIAGLVTVARDVTELRKNEHRIRQQHDRLMLAARVGGLGIWDYHFGRDELHCDEQWYRIMGRDPARPIRSIGEFYAFVHPEDAERVMKVRETLARHAADKQDFGIVFRVVRPDGQNRWVRTAASIVENARGVPVRAVGFAVDITEARLTEERLEKEALEDPLTMLANRRRLDQELDRACRLAARADRPLALAMIDVDFFKMYNDRYGHAQGDAALKAVAGILAAAARRPYDLAARYGGEEFVLLMPEVDRPEAVFERIVAQLAALKLRHEDLPLGPWLTVSCGCAVASRAAGLRPADLLAASDRALYRAKQDGRDRLIVTRL